MDAEYLRKWLLEELDVLLVLKGRVVGARKHLDNLVRELGEHPADELRKMSDAKCGITSIPTEAYKLRARLGEAIKKIGDKAGSCRYDMSESESLVRTLSAAYQALHRGAAGNGSRPSRTKDSGSPTDDTR